MQAPLPVSKPLHRPLRAFLSSATEDQRLVDAFSSRMERQHPDLEILDHAVRDHYEENWRQECARKIARSDMLICFVGATTHRSDAVAWEVQCGLSLGKRIITVNLSEDGAVSRSSHARRRQYVSARRSRRNAVISLSNPPPHNEQSSCM